MENLISDYAKAYAEGSIDIRTCINICDTLDELEYLIDLADIIKAEEVISELEEDKQAQIEHSWIMFKSAKDIALDNIMSAYYNEEFDKEHNRQAAFNITADESLIPSDREIFILCNAIKAAEYKASHNKIAEFFKRYNLNIEEQTMFYITYNITYYDNRF